MTKSKFIIHCSVAILMILLAASLCPAAEDMGHHHRQRQGHVLPVRPRSAEADEADRREPDGPHVEGLDRERLRGLPAPGRADGHRAVRRARVRGARAVGPGPDRASRRRRGWSSRSTTRKSTCSASKGIRDFDDLAGKRVAIGRDGSGTYLTARLLFKLSEVAPSEMVPIDTGEALAELKAGRIDAMFYVAGYPVKLLEGGRHREGRARADPDHQQEHHRVLSARRDPGQRLRVAADAGQQRGGQGGAGLLRFPPKGLRQRRPLRPDHIAGR